MRICQAIVASAVETLDGRQGFGLVYCSQALPETIRQEAKGLGYSSDAGDHPIYSLKRIEVSGVQWLLMNRTVPTVDYTGRTSHVSHTVAVEEQSLDEFFSDKSSITSVFEFMCRFEWRQSWNESSRWLDDEDDVKASNADFFSSAFSDERMSMDPRPLLAFDFLEGSKPKPKRAVWQIQDKTPEGMLKFFHQAWLGLDPWRGTRKYGDLLGEPAVSLLDSWRYSFTTNLRHGQSDGYQWVVASPDCPSIPNRELIEPSKWESLTPDSIKQKIGPPFGGLLVDRCVQGPDAWAQSELRLLLDKLKQEYAEKAQIKSKGVKDQVEAIVSDFRGKVDALKASIVLYEKEGFWSFDKEADIEKTRHQILEREMNAKGAAENLMKEYHEKADAVAGLLTIDRVSGSDELLAEPHCFPEFLAVFDRLADEYRNKRRIVYICDYAKSWVAEGERLKRENAELNSKLRSTITELEVAKTSYQKLSAQGRTTTSASAGKKDRSDKVQPWHMIAFFAFSVLVIVMVVWLIMSGRLSVKNDVNIREAKPKFSRREAILDEENLSLKDDIKRQDFVIKSLNEKIDNLNKLVTFKHESPAKPVTESTADSGNGSKEGGKPANTKEQKSATAGAAATVEPPTEGVDPKPPAASQSHAAQEASAPPASDNGSGAAKGQNPESNKTSK